MVIDMRVSSVKGLERKEPIRKTRKAASAITFSTESNKDEVANIQEDISISSMYSIQSIVSLQNMVSVNNLEETNYEKYQNLLGKLHKLLNSILAENKIDKNLALQNLLKALSAERIRSTNDKLENIIDEIELRAAVELAKNRSN